MYPASVRFETRCVRNVSLRKQGIAFIKVTKFKNSGFLKKKEVEEIFDLRERIISTEKS
jgi:hypothetical protein